MKRGIWLSGLLLPGLVACSPAATPVPSATSRPGITPTAMPSSTPRPTQTATPTVTATPTPEPPAVDLTLPFSEWPAELLAAHPALKDPYRAIAKVRREDDLWLADQLRRTLYYAGTAQAKDLFGYKLLNAAGRSPPGGLRPLSSPAG